MIVTKVREDALLYSAKEMFIDYDRLSGGELSPVSNYYLNQKDAEYQFRQISYSFLRRPLFRALLTAYGRRRTLKGYIALYAHGDDWGNQWVYRDDGSLYRVQGWIDEHDGALALFVFCCNKANANINARQSAVFHFSQDINFTDAIRGRVNVRLYLPGIGYVEQNRRLIHHTIAQLKKCC